MTEDFATDERTEINAEAQEAVDKASTYEFGWSSDIEQDFAPKGLNEGTVRF
ncbi:Iron-sulfur cluster assembly protein SufB, partial [hydrothermal vent metagenome]